jgi:Tol biopolymer transport system component
MLRVWCGAALVLTALFATANMALSREWAVGAMDDDWQVVFSVRNLNGGGFVGYIMDLDGSNIQPLKWMGEPITNPICSPDGSYLAFTATPNSLYVVSADGREIYTSYDGVYSNFAGLSVSNNGKTVLLTGMFDNGDRAERGVLILNTETSPSSSVYPNGVLGITSHAAINSDGTRIVFATAFGDIHTINTDLTDLSGAVAQGAQPEWSPDGSMVVFVAGENFLLYDVDRTLTVRLTDFVSGRPPIIFPIWTPNGSSILYSSHDTENFSILYMVNVDDGRQKLFTNPPTRAVSACMLKDRPYSLITTR